MGGRQDRDWCSYLGEPCRQDGPGQGSSKGKEAGVKDAYKLASPWLGG